MNGRRQPNLKVVPARNGIAWLAQSLHLMRTQPGRLLFLALLLQMLLGLARLPVLGILVILAMPALSAGLLQAFQLVGQARRPAISVLFMPLTAGTRTARLLALGALTFVVGLLSVSLILAGSENMLDPNLLASLEQGDMDALVAMDPAIVGHIILAVAVGVSLSGTLSFMSIPLVWFRDWKLGLALLDGLRALIVNWKAFSLLALGLIGLLLPVVVAVGVLFQLAGPPGGLSFVLIALIMVIALAFQLVVFGTQYCSFRDIFGTDSDPGQAVLQTDHQLLA